MAEDTKLTETQLSLQLQINQVLQDRQKILKAQEKYLSNQVQQALDLCKALDCKNLDDVEDRMKAVQDGLRQAADDADKFGDSMEGAVGKGAAGAKRTSDELGGLNKKTGALAGGLVGLGGGFISAFKSVGATLSNIGNIVGNVTGSVFKLGMTILAAPFRILSGLIGMSQMGGGGPSPIRVELENIRKEMGGLNNIAGKAAARALPAFREQLSNVAGTGISVRRMFGVGRQGLAKAMAYNLELMKAFGTSASKMSKFFTKDTIPALAAYRKGLGITAEEQASLMKRAQNFGKDPVDAMREFASYAIQMGDAVGMSGNEIGKRMAAAAADIENFGTLSVRALSEATAFAAKLGIEIKELTGVIGKFENFEDAAQNAAKLSQAFGLNIDAMAMMKEQNPAKQLAMLQKAFKDSGQSFESMDRATRKYLASTAGLTAEQAELAFSQKGLTASYDDIQKAGGKAEKKQLTQAEAMSKLADSIERVFGSGGSQFTSFFDAFSKGFERGFRRAKAMRKLLRNIRKSLRVVYRAGIRMGKMFVELFPGVKKMAGALSSVFNPRKIHALMKEVQGVFKTFFLDLRTDPKAGFERFVDNIKETFLGFFGRQGTAVDTFLEGGKDMLRAFGGIFQGLVVVAARGLAQLLDLISNTLRNPPEVSGALGETLRGLADSFIELLSTVWDIIWPALKNFGVTLFEKFGPIVEEYGPKVLRLFIMRAVLTSILSGVKGAFVGAIGGGLGKIAKVGFLKLFGGLTDNVPTPPPTPPAEEWKSVGKSLVKFAAVVGIVLVAFAAAAAIYKGLSLTPEDAVGIGIFMVSISLAAAATAAAMKLIPDELPSPGQMVTLGVFLLGLGAVGALTMKMLTMVKPTPSVGQVTAFSAVMMTLLTTALPLIAGAYIIGQMKNNVKEAIIGMAILGGFMIAIGVIGTIIAGILSLIPDPTGVAALMEGISSIMYATMLMLPVALTLGVMLAAAPFGPIGLAAMATGMAVLGGLATLMISTLMPAMQELAKIQIPNPDAFKAVTGALVNIMHAINGFVLALSGLAIVLRPTSGQTNPGAFQENINVFSGLVETILQSGVGDIINQLISFARTADVTEGTAQAVQGISGIMSAVASLMSAFSPSDAAFAAIGQATVTWGEDSVRTTKAISSMLESSRNSIPGLLNTLGKFIPSMIKSLAGIPPDAGKIAPLVGALGSIFTAVASLMKAFQPSDAAWQAAGSAADNWGESQTETIASIGETMTSMRQEMTDFLPVLQHSITDIVDGMMDSLLPILGALDGADPKALSAVATIISSTINGVSSMFGVLGPAIQAAQERASAENASPDAFGSTLDHIKRMMEAIGPTIGKMREPLKTLVNNVIQIAKGIEDPRRLGPKIEVLSATIDAVSSITRALSPGGALATLANLGDQDLSATITRVSSAVQTLRRSNVIEQMVGLINTVPRNIESRLETIASIGQHVSTLTQSLSNIELDSIVALNESLSGDGRLSITHDNVNVTLNVRVNMSARDIGRGVLEVNNNGTNPFGNGGRRFAEG